jgi:hypothetical protein
MGGARRVSPIIAAVATTAATIAHAAPVDRTAWLERVERGRKDYAAFIEKASLSHPATATARFADPRPGLSYSDPTLRDGDIVVDGDRLVVFRNRRVGAPFAGELLPLDPDAAHDHAAELKDIARALRAFAPGGR